MYNISFYIMSENIAGPSSSKETDELYLSEEKNSDLSDEEDGIYLKS